MFRLSLQLYLFLPSPRDLLNLFIIIYYSQKCTVASGQPTTTSAASAISRLTQKTGTVPLPSLSVASTWINVQPLSGLLVVDQNAGWAGCWPPFGQLTSYAIHGSPLRRGTSSDVNNSNWMLLWSDSTTTHYKDWKFSLLQIIVSSMCIWHCACSDLVWWMQIWIFIKVINHD